MRKYLVYIIASIILAVNTNSYAQDASINGTITAPAQAVTLNLDSFATVTVQITGTYTGGDFDFEVSANGTDFVPVPAIRISDRSLVSDTSANGAFSAWVPGFTKFRVLGAAISSGSASVSIVASAGPNTLPVALVSPLPVTGPLTDTQLRAAPVPVSAASLPLPTGAATEATVAGILTDTQLRATPVPVSGPLTDTQLRATPVPVSGTVATGGLTDAELRASPVPVTTDGLTDAELRAAPVPVSAASLPLPTGAATEATVAGLLTNTQLRATPVDANTAQVAGNTVATGTGAATNATQRVATANDSYLADRTATGTIDAPDEAVTITGLASHATALVFVDYDGSWDGTLFVEGTIDGTNWTVIPDIVSYEVFNFGVRILSPYQGANRVNIVGFSAVRVRASVVDAGSVEVTLLVSQRASSAYYDAPIRLWSNTSSVAITDRGSVPTSSDQGLVVRQVGIPAAAANGDTVTPVTASGLYSWPMLFNGATYDRWRGSAARGADININALGGSAVASTGLNVQTGPGVFIDTNNVGINGITPSTGTGSSDTGTQRVMPANQSQFITDGSAIACLADGVCVIYGDQQLTHVRLRVTVIGSPGTLTPGCADTSAADHGLIGVGINGVPITAITVTGISYWNTSGCGLRLTQSGFASGSFQVGVARSNQPLNNVGPGTNLTAIAGAPIQTGSGNATGVPRFELANNGTGTLASITSSVVPGTAATNLGKAEDAGVNSGDTLVGVAYQRKDTAAVLTSAENEYGNPTIDAYGTTRVTSDHVNRVNCAITSTATTSTLVTRCSAPGAGLSIYITSLQWSSSIISTTTNFMLIQDGTGGTCGTSTAVRYRGFALAFTTVPVVFNTPIKVDANSEICFLHPGAGTRFVSIQGFIAP